MHPALKYIHHKFLTSQTRWYPFLAVYYLTFRCNFRCPYCSNGHNQPYYQLPPDILSADEVMNVFRRIRQFCDYLVITGGEPLQHPAFAQIISRAGELGFSEIALNTNGYEFEQYLPEIANSVHTLIFSLDTLDEKKADAWFGAGKGVLRKICSNIMLAAAHPGRKYRIVISSVITPQNIPDLYHVYAFAKDNGFTFAACPQLKGVKAPRELTASSAYKDFFNFLISEKKDGNLVFGSPLYLASMRDLKKFPCHPFTMLVVDPTGWVYYPCLELGNIAGNILAGDNLHTLRQKGLSQFGPQPDCDTRCHSACALGFSLIINSSYSMVQEASLTLMSLVKRGWNFLTTG